MGLKSEDSATAHIQTILRFALALRDATGVLRQPGRTPITSSSHTVIDSINLPSPPPLLSFLLEAGINQEIAAAASKVYQLRSDELRQHVQESIVTTCYKIAELPVVTLASSPESFIQNVVSSFTEVYLRRLEHWKEEIIDRIKQASKSSSNVVSKTSRTFNHEYIPLLEHFFEENPFPTHADKMFLAKKSNMEYRQIHVWFQNRRNRTKESKTSRKKPTCEGVTKPLDKLYELMKGHIVASDSQVPEPFKAGSSEETMQNNIPKDAFTSSSPPHAFPSSYPPTCHDDPFPCKRGATCFGKPEWRRLPDGKHPLPLLTSIDDLVEKFSHLNVRDGARSKGSLKLQSHAATAAITVTPSRAPHPSLIVRKYPQPTKMVRPLLSVRAPVSWSRAFQSPSANSTPLTLVPPSTQLKKSELPGKRKTAPLPRRFPGRIQNTRRDTTPSESSSASSPSPRLFPTDTETRSYSLSSISSPSTSSGATGVRLFGSPCRSPLGSPIHLRSLGNMVTISPPSVS